MSTISDLKQILQEDGSGRNLYDHMVEVLMKILVDRPANAYESFELISSEVKSNPLNPDPEKGRPIPPSEDEINSKILWTKKCSELLKVPAEQPEDNGIKYPDLLEDANLLEWANVGFGRGEIYRLYLSIKKFSENPELPSDVGRIRFVGKIVTRGKPYYVIEGLSTEDDESDPRLQEDRTGANKYTYWVTQSVDSAPNAWTKLPHVTSAQVMAARLSQRLLTGDLDAPVTAYPPFPASKGPGLGKEKNFLRALLARVVGETSISPDGFFEIDPDSEDPVLKTAEPEAFNESFPKPALELRDASAWRHHEIELNSIGRALKMPEPEEGEAEGDAGEAEEFPEPTELYREARPDSWTFRLCPGGAGAGTGSGVVARSLVWPGAVAVYSGRRYLNLYVGSGTQLMKFNEKMEKFQGERYSPPLPPPLQKEYQPTEDDQPLKEAEDPPNKDPTPPPVEGEEED